MPGTLADKISSAVDAVGNRAVLRLVWCDPRRDWLPLLQRAAELKNESRAKQEALQGTV